ALGRQRQAVVELTAERVAARRTDVERIGVGPLDVSRRHGVEVEATLPDDRARQGQRQLAIIRDLAAPELPRAAADHVPDPVRELTSGRGGVHELHLRAERVAGTLPEHDSEGTVEVKQRHGGSPLTYLSRI